MNFGPLKNQFSVRCSEYFERALSSPVRPLKSFCNSKWLYRRHAQVYLCTWHSLYRFPQTYLLMLKHFRSSKFQQLKFTKLPGYFDWPNQNIHRSYSIPAYTIYDVGPTNSVPSLYSSEAVMAMPRCPFNKFTSRIENLLHTPCICSTCTNPEILVQCNVSSSQPEVSNYQKIQKYLTYFSSLCCTLSARGLFLSLCSSGQNIRLNLEDRKICTFWSLKIYKQVPV